MDTSESFWCSRSDGDWCGLMAQDREDVEDELELDDVEEKPTEEWEAGDEDGIDEGVFLADLSPFFMAFSRFCLRHLARRFLNHTFFFF